MRQYVLHVSSRSSSGPSSATRGRSWAASASSRSATARSSASAPTRPRCSGTSTGSRPWIGVLVAMAAAVVLALVVAYPCSRFGIIGHYFGLVTLAVGEVVRLLLIAERDWTGGSLGLTLKSAGDASFRAIQYARQARLLLRRRSSSGSAASGCGTASTARWRARPWRPSARTRRPPRPSASMSPASSSPSPRSRPRSPRWAASLYAQYIAYVNPETLAGVGVSLRIVFAVVLGGMYSLLGPTVGTALTISLSEYLRVKFGVHFIGMAETIYGLVLVIFIIFLPSGIYGQRARPARPPPRPATPRAGGAPEAHAHGVDDVPRQDAVARSAGARRRRWSRTAATCSRSTRSRSATTGRSSACCRATRSRRAPTSATSRRRTSSG